MNKVLAAEGKSRANHKRIFRTMKPDFCFGGTPAAVRGDCTTAKVMAMRSNLRRCSDAFEITRRKGSSSSSMPMTGECSLGMPLAGVGISGSMVRDLMLKAVEQRFGTTQAPHAVERDSE
jgi:putative transposase